MTRVWKEKNTKSIFQKSLQNVTSARFDVLSINIVTSPFLHTKWFFQLISFGRWKLISSEMTSVCMVNRRVEKWSGVSWGSYWLLFLKVGVGLQLTWGARADPDVSERGGALNSLKNNTIFTEKKAFPSADPQIRPWDVTLRARVWGGVINSSFWNLDWNSVKRPETRCNS